MDREERIQRLQAEYDELSDRVAKLQDFMNDFYYKVAHDPTGIDSEVFSAEPMLVSQLKAMLKYRKALAVRISFMLLHPERGE